MIFFKKRSSFWVTLNLLYIQYSYHLQGQQLYLNIYTRLFGSCKNAKSTFISNRLQNKVLFIRSHEAIFLFGQNCLFQASIFGSALTEKPFTVAGIRTWDGSDVSKVPLKLCLRPLAAL